jgi:hypothetical protein
MPKTIAIEKDSRQTARCRSCDASIEWAVTVPNNKRMPFDHPITLSAAIDPTLPAGVVLVDMDQTRSHFSTCPDADRWRKNKAPKGARVTALLAAAGLLTGACDVRFDMTPAASPTAPTAPTTITNTNTNTSTNNNDRSDTEPTTTPTPNGTGGQAVPLPSYGEQVTRGVAAQNPALLANSCQETAGESAWQFLDLLIRTLRAQDQRWGYLCKDANCLTFARDVIAYKATAAETGIWIVDVIGNHCPGPGETAAIRYGVLPFETSRRWAAARKAGVFP